jgi:CubicO group peptidase (beta-lactamase class C family)
MLYLLFALPLALIQAPAPVYPGAEWATRTPEQAGLSRPRLDALRDLVGGRGCVVCRGYLVYAWGDITKSGDIASAVKPIISTLLLLALQEGLLKSVDDPVADFEPRLATLSDGRYRRITWRHLASQTSGYGLTETPGTAYAYNDYALALYYDTLTQKVFKQPGTQVLRTRLGDVLQFQDRYTFEAFGAKDRPGRLAISVRDLARFGLLYLRGGRWHDKQLLRPELVKMAIDSPIPADLPLTAAKDGDMLPGQRTLGGGKNITRVGPGYYSFNWWLNRTDKEGRRLFPDAPHDAYVASGHGGKRTLWVIPSLDLVVAWNDSPVDDHDKSPGNPDTKCNQAVRLMRLAVEEGGKPARGKTALGIQGTKFTVNGRPTFLYGISYYAGLGASPQTRTQDLDEIQKLGFNWIRVWATWSAFDANISAVDGEGKPRPEYLERLKALVAECDRRGMIVDVTLSRGNAVTGPPRLQGLEAHRRAVETLVTALKPYDNWYLDLSNERNIKDKRFTSIDDLRELRALVRKLDPRRLVTASHAGELTEKDVQDYLVTAGLDFLSPHRPRRADSPGKTEAASKQVLTWMKELKREVPLHYQEPFRRGFGKWEPNADDFVTDLRGALQGGAAGWCFHNGDERARKDGVPRRSFDLREKRLFEQLDAVEREALKKLQAVFSKRQAPAGGALAGERLRVIISTDVGGNDPDDFQSMVHLLLYADVLDLEGLISSPPGKGRVRDLLEVIDAYEKDYPNLKTHSKTYPPPAALRALCKQGATDPAPKAGHSQPTEGSRWLIDRARAADDRPLYVLVWGSITDVAQAVHNAPDIKKKIRVYFIGSSNTKNDRAARDYLYREHADLWLVEADTTFRGMYVGGRQDSDLGNKTFLAAHVQGHGALGDLLMRKKSVLKMGDTPSVLYLLRGDPSDPTAEHWGGSFARTDHGPHYWTDNPDPALREGNFAGAKTVSRWREDYLRDWQGRMKRTRPMRSNEF